jgi:hypothetical protein
MQRRLGAVWTTLVAITLLAALSTTALGQAEATATSAGGTRVTASATAQVKVDKDTADPQDPVPFNILDEADDQMFSCLLGWSSKYRMQPDIGDGAWVKYESLGDGPKETLEIRAERTESGQIWLIETTTKSSGATTELHTLFTPGKPRLMEAFRIDEEGNRHDLPILDELTNGELFLEARQIARDAVGNDPNKYKVADCPDVTEITGPFGTMMCRCVEVKIAEEVDPISFETRRLWLPEGTLIWMNMDVPRIMPMSAVLLPSLLSPDDMMSVPGGLVRSPYHVLIDYKGKE